MAKAGRKKKTVQKTPKHQYVTNAEKEIFRQAVIKYCKRNKLNAKDLDGKLDKILKIVPIVGESLSEWQDMKKETFDYRGGKKHQALFDCIRNYCKHKQTINELVDAKDGESEINEEDSDEEEGEQEVSELNDIQPFEDKNKNNHFNLDQKSNNPPVEKSPAQKSIKSD